MRGKKILSALTALAITASSFAAMAIPASAAAKEYYKETFDSYTDASGWTTKTNDRYTPVLMTKEGGTDKYISVNQAQRNNNGTTVTGGLSVTDNNVDSYAVEFDAKIGSGNNQANAALQVNTNSGYLFKIKQTANNSTKWLINDTQTVDLPDSATTTAEDESAINSLAWYHFIVAYGNSCTYVTIKDATGAEVLKQTLVQNGAPNDALKNITFDTGRYYANLAIDNIVVRDLEDNEIPSNKFFNLNITTNRYAKVTYNNEVKYADVNGKLQIPLLAEGTVVNYTIEKTNYAPETGSITMTEDKDVNKTLTWNGTGEEPMYIETEFGNANGAFVVSNRGDEVQLGEITLPKTAEITMNVDVNKAEEKQFTLKLKNKDGKDVVGIQGNTDGLWAYTGFTGKNTDNTDINQSGGEKMWTNGAKLADSYVGNYDIKFVLSQDTNSVTVTCGDTSVSLPTIAGTDISNLKSIQIGKYREYATVKIDNFVVAESDPNYVSVKGDNEFAAYGKTVTRQYECSPAVSEAGENFAWTVSGSSAATINNGLLTVDGTKLTSDATLTITATSDKNSAKVGTFTAKVHKTGTLYPVIEGAKAVTVGDDSQMYSVEKVTDNYGDDVTGLFEPVWSVEAMAPSQTIDVDTTQPKVQVLFATYEGNALKKISTQTVNVSDDTVTVTPPANAKIYVWESLTSPKAVADVSVAGEAGENGSGITADGAFTASENAENVNLSVALGDFTFDYPVTVGTYSIVGDYVAEEQVDVSSIVEDDKIEGYRVTIADADGKMLYDNSVTELGAGATITLPAQMEEEGTPAKYEISPVYYANMNEEILVPKGTYDVIVNANKGARTDVYANDQLIINNLNQGSDNWTVGRILPEEENYGVNDIVIKEGYVTFNYRDDKSGQTTVNKVALMKAPSITTKVKKIYVIGDSLVANYYGTAPVGQEKLVRTGWGQVLQDYINEDVEVVNLGNSGAWAEGMLSDAFTNVRESAQEGDILVLESGYNDKSHSTVEKMNNAITQMVEEAEEKGMEVFLVTPNASAHDYKADVAWAAEMRTLYETLTTNGSNARLIDLSKLSKEFFDSWYPTQNNDVLLATYNNSGDTLHSSYNAANCWAAIIANGLLKDNATKDVVKTDHEYTFNDGTNNIMVSANQIKNPNASTTTEVTE